MATGTGARHTAPAFHESLSLRGALVNAGVSDAALQIGNSEKLIGGAARRDSACAPKGPGGRTKTGAAPACTRRRRLTADTRFSSRLMSKPLAMPRLRRPANASRLR